MLNLSGSPGALFNALGKCGLLIKNVNSFQSTLLTSMTNATTGLVGQLNAESDIQALVGSDYINELTNLEGCVSLAQNVAEQYLNRLVFRDVARYSQNLVSLNTSDSITYLINQMNTQGATILQMTVTSSPVLFSNNVSNVGNGVIIASTKRPLDGRTLENAYGETVLFTCSADSYTGSATKFNESFSVQGQGSEGDFFAFDWPLGSNFNTSLSAIDGDTSNASGNLLTNSGFATFVNTPNVPDNWSLTVGVAGTDVKQNSSIVYSTGNSLQLVGNGTTKTSLQQTFGSSTGTASTLSPLTQYSFNLFARTSGSAPASGVLQVDLCDQNGNVILDQGGTSNSFTIALTGLTTTWTNFGAMFRAPRVLPTQVNLRLHLTTALANTANVFLDKASLGLATQGYTAGPFFALHSGSIPFVLNDSSTCGITNSRGAGGTLSTFQTLFARLFPTYAYGSEIMLPSSLVPSIADALIG